MFDSRQVKGLTRRKGSALGKKDKQTNRQTDRQTGTQLETQAVVLTCDWDHDLLSPYWRLQM